MIRAAWNILSGVKLTFWLIIVTAAMLFTGSRYIAAFPDIFRSMNSMLLQEWFMQTGMHHPGRIWWLALLFAALAILAVNTVCCAARRFAAIRRRRPQGLRKFLVLMTPTVIHFLFVFILAGHFLGSVTGSIRNVSAAPGDVIDAGSGRTIAVLALNPEYRTAPGPLQGFLTQTSAELELRGADGASRTTVRILRPVFWHGMSIHLDVPKGKEAPPQVRVIIREDHGLAPIVLGFIAIIALMVWYFPQIRRMEDTD